MRIKSAFIFIIFLLLNASPLIALAQESEIVHFPRLSAEVSPNEFYIHELLRLALKNSKTPYQLVQAKADMQQARSIYEISSPIGRVDLMWSMATEERETQMIAIKIPIDKGLLGWRIPLVKKEQANLLENIKSAPELSVYSAGQEHDWPDVPILKANRLPVVTSTSYEALFNMLQGGRFDYLPRSIFEIWKEVEAHPKHNMHIDQHIILHYPAALYFFVAQRRPKLAEDLRFGLELAIKDGSFEKLFKKHNQISIDRANIKHRTIIELNNPLFHLDKLNGYRPELWFQP